MPPPTVCSPDDQRRPGRRRGVAACDSMSCCSLWLAAKSNGLWNEACRLEQLALDKRAPINASQIWRLTHRPTPEENLLG